jgi:hypothetical protein
MKAIKPLEVCHNILIARVCDACFFRHSFETSAIWEWFGTSRWFGVQPQTSGD